MSLRMFMRCEKGLGVRGAEKGPRPSLSKE